MSASSRIALAIILTASIAHSASIGVFSAPDCSSCDATIPPGGMATVYVCATDVAGGDFPYGIDGAEFSVTGLPSGWTAVSTPSPMSSVSIGNPFGAGANIAFAFLNAGDCVLLYTVRLTADAVAGYAALRVTRHTTPSNPQYACPLLVYDTGITFYRYCVPGGTLLVNSNTPCSVGIEPATWTALRALYR